MSVVIIGGGQAGVQVADSLRNVGYSEPITIIAEEIEFPYQRPPLSKDFIQGATANTPAVLPLRPSEFFDTNDIELLRGQKATHIDPRTKTVYISDKSIPYDYLVLATGSVNRTLDCPGAQADGISSLRTLDDAQRLHAELATAESVTVVGAGFIGLEFAAAAAGRGCSVSVVNRGERPLRRSVSTVVADWVTRWHQDCGVEFRFGQTVTAFDMTPSGRVAACRTTAGDVIATDLVVVGVGARANDSLAAEAGLATNNGVLVNASLQTSDPAIFAVGDCATFPAGWADGGFTRVESVQNAVDQAKHIAHVIIGGSKPYVDVPWFWSIQGKNRLQMAGVSNQNDDVLIIGSMEDAKFAALCFRDDLLTAVETVNMPGEHIAARKVLSESVPLYVDDVTGSDFSVKAFLKHATEAVARVR